MKSAVNKILKDQFVLMDITTFFSLFVSLIVKNSFVNILFENFLNIYLHPSKMYLCNIVHSMCTICKYTNKWLWMIEVEGVRQQRWIEKSIESILIKDNNFCSIEMSGFAFPFNYFWIVQLSLIERFETEMGWCEIF